MLTRLQKGHHLWNAGRTVADYIEERASQLIEGKTILELGAGAGLPSLICAIKGASTVVVTDYPDADLITNLAFNIDHCKLFPTEGIIHAKGFIWGAAPDQIMAYLPRDQSAGGYDVLILADLLFNHSEHSKLLDSVKRTLKPSPKAVALVFFTPYRPWLLQKDLAFFDLARDAGLMVTKTFEKVMDKVMFEEDPGVSGSV